jgi:hypothetical protein
MGPGLYEKAILNAEDVAYTPIASTHYLKALGNEGAWAILMFDGSPLTTIELPAFLSQVPQQVRLSPCCLP